MRGGVTRRPGTAARRGDALINAMLLKCPATGALDPGPGARARGPGPPGAPARAHARAHARAQGPGPSSEFRVGSKGGRRGGRRQCTGKCSDSRRGAQDKASSCPPGAGRLGVWGTGPPRKANSLAHGGLYLIRAPWARGPGGPVRASGFEAATRGPGAMRLTWIFSAPGLKLTSRTPGVLGDRVTSPGEGGAGR